MLVCGGKGIILHMRFKDTFFSDGQHFYPLRNSKGTKAGGESMYEHN